MITICINTRNRYRQLKKCLKSIYDNNFDLNKYEIIVIDQSDKFKTVPKSIFYRKNIKYFKSNKTGTGIAKNIAIAKTKKSILVFTDDDCLSSLSI